ncbi:MAG TPA: NAD(P)-dependent oxidoreductase [Synechococcales cyanobacterium M55_K2018_004]|nr:NAD(P)-dependent oxidoreductase [Synechococcales cyanobacterium M55_K2018_004]
MSSKRILLTGASGCIGHYIAERLIQATDHELFLLVRDPQKLKIDVEARPGVTVLQGDMRQIERFGNLLKTIHTAILTATAWGDPQMTYDVNVVKTIRLMNLLDPEVCEQVIYFSTESILDHDNKPLKEAGEIGTDYIRTKYICHQQLPKLAIAPKITTVFPTLVFGGDETKPKSHLTAGLPGVIRWLGLARFFKADASFHFVHGEDIARVVVHLTDNPPPAGAARELVLGSAPITVNQAIADLCRYFNKRIYLQIPLTPALANIFIRVFRIRMAAWDRFCLNYRHFTHKDPVSPAQFGLPVYCETISDLMRASNIGPRKKPVLRPKFEE